MSRKKNLPSNMNIKGTAKVFPYYAGVDAIAEGNSVQMPSISEYKGDRITALEYIWHTKTPNGLIKRGLFVSGHGEYGVPTTRENDILAALQRIFINKKTKNGVCELEMENITEDYLNIEFTISELAKELGIGTPNSKIRENIKQSIEILVSTTIKSLYQGGIYDIKNKQYIINSEIMFHYIETSQGFSIVDEDGNIIKDITRIRLSRFFYDQIAHDYKLFYNPNIIKRTKNTSARKLYQMVLQWKGENDFACATLDTLIERMPMREDRPKYQKQFIKKLIKILDEKEMCKVTYDKDNPDKVYFIFNKSEKAFTKKFNTFKEIKEGMKSLGFIDEEIDDVLDIEKIEYIKALLRYLDYKKRYDEIPHPKNLFLSYLKNSHPIDLKYFDGQ